GTAEATGLEEGENVADKGASEQTGRPENAPGGMPIPSVPPSEPKPPELPPPNPGEPAPIPKKSEPLKLLTTGAVTDNEPSPGEDEPNTPPPTKGHPKPPGAP